MSRSKTRISSIRFISSFYFRDLKFQNRGGFTLIELIIFSAIFSLISIIFVAMLVSITGVQLRQTASSEVNRQSQFVLQTIQRYIENASLIETETTSTPIHSLLLRMPTGSADTSSLVSIYWETSTISSAIYLKSGTSTPEAITSPKVIVDDLTFRKFSRPNAHDSVSFSMALSYHASSTGKRFFQRLSTTASRVSAATFDTSLLPQANIGGLTLGLGAAGSMWTSINDAIFFESGKVTFPAANVGVGTNAPTARFHVIGNSLFEGDLVTVNSDLIVGTNKNVILYGDLRLGDNTNVVCDNGHRGFLRFKFDLASAFNDELQVCGRFGGSLGWRAVSTTDTGL